MGHWSVVAPPVLWAFHLCVSVDGATLQVTQRGNRCRHYCNRTLHCPIRKRTPASGVRCCWFGTFWCQCSARSRALSPLAATHGHCAALVSSAHVMKREREIKWSRRGRGIGLRPSARQPAALLRHKPNVGVFNSVNRLPTKGWRVSAHTHMSVRVG